MISNEIEFDQAIQQMDRMYRALAGLKSRLSSAHPSQFQMMAEGPIDEIRRLQVDIDAYLGVTVVDGSVARSTD